MPGLVPVLLYYSLCISMYCTLEVLGKADQSQGSLANPSMIEISDRIITTKKDFRTFTCTCTFNLVVDLFLVITAGGKPVVPLVS